MNLQEAIKSCMEGNFVTHESFDCKQSMHMYKHTLYYEDGCNLTHHLKYIESQELFKEGWKVKYLKEKVNQEVLDYMHRKHRSFMLENDNTYEVSILKFSKCDDCKCTYESCSCKTVGGTCAYEKQ